MKILLFFFWLFLLFSQQAMAYDQCTEHPRTLIRFGERFLAMGNIERAIANYSKVIACHENTSFAAEAHNDLGVAFARQGNYCQAMQEYKTALSINEYPLARFNIARLYKMEYDKHGDEIIREQAIEQFSLFQEYLMSGSDLPPVITYQLEEIKDYVRKALIGMDP